MWDLFFFNDTATTEIYTLSLHDALPILDALLGITGSENLLDDSPVLQRSIRLRNPYVDPLSYIQVSLLRRLRTLPEDSPERETVLNTLLLTISGISSGMLNTGQQRQAKISPRGRNSR